MDYIIWAVEVLDDRANPQEPPAYVEIYGNGEVRVGGMPTTFTDRNWALGVELSASRRLRQPCRVVSVGTGTRVSDPIDNDDFLLNGGWLCRVCSRRVLVGENLGLRHEPDGRFVVHAECAAPPPALPPCNDVELLQSRVERLEACLRAFQASDPRDYAELTRDYTCRACESCAPWNEQIVHTADCPWTVAAALLAEAPEEKKEGGEQ